MRDVWRALNNDLENYTSDRCNYHHHWLYNVRTNKTLLVIGNVYRRYSIISRQGNEIYNKELGGKEMKTTIHTKKFKELVFKNVIQVSITHTGTTEDDDDYNTLQVVHLNENNQKVKTVIRLSEISTSFTLEDNQL